MLFDTRALGITIWNVDTAEALYNIPIASPGMGLTADRQIMALATPTGITLIDLTACEHIAFLPLATAENWRSLAFSDDNRRLAGLCDRGMFLWDLTTGKLLREFWHQTMANVATMRFAGDFLLLDEQYLYDPERRILLWEYADRPEATTTIRYGRMWAVVRGSDRTQPTSVVTAKVPHAKAIETAAGLGAPEELIIAKPGDQVAIKIDIDPSVASTDEVRAAIAANLVAAGFKVVDQADLVLTAVCRRKDPQTIKLSKRLGGMVDPASIVEKTITPHASYVTLTCRGEKVFDQGYLATPGGSIHVQHNENLDQALSRLTSPNIEMIKTARYASYIARGGTATPNGAYGTSRFATKE